MEWMLAPQMVCKKPFYNSSLSAMTKAPIKDNIDKSEEKLLYQNFTITVLFYKFLGKAGKVNLFVFIRFYQNTKSITLSGNRVVQLLNVFRPKGSF